MRSCSCCRSSLSLWSTQPSHPPGYVRGAWVPPTSSWPSQEEQPQIIDVQHMTALAVDPVTALPVDHLHPALALEVASLVASACWQSRDLSR